MLAVYPELENFLIDFLGLIVSEEDAILPSSLGLSSDF